MSDTKSVVIATFGRFNPIHVGHAKIFNVILDLKKKYESQGWKTRACIYMSSSHDSKKNPLSPQDKEKWGKKIFKGVEVKAIKGSMIDVARMNTGATKLVFVIGSDRTPTANALFPKYNHKEYDFDEVEIYSKGLERFDADSDDLTSAAQYSASKMRKFATDENFEAFKKGMDFKGQSGSKASNLTDDEVKKVYNAVRAGLGLSVIKEDHRLMRFTEFREEVSTDALGSCLMEAVVNKHSTHIEELIFTNGKKGLTNAIEGMRYIVKTIGEGNPSGVSTKIDGAPAVFFGYDADGKFFVSSKGIAAKTPKVNYTDADIAKNHAGGVVAKLKDALKHLPAVTPKAKSGNDYFAFQGDLLFGAGDKKTVKNPTTGVDCIAFHPNTIMYTVEKTSPIGKAIDAAKFGIAIHTKYKWDGVDPKTFDVCAYGISKSEFPLAARSKDVFLIDTVSNLVAGASSTFSDGEVGVIDTALKSAESLGNSVNWNVMTNEGSSEIAPLIMQFVNTYIRKNIKMPDASRRVEEFLGWIEEKYMKDFGSKKTKRGQDAATARYAPMRNLNKFKSDLEKFFLMFDHLTTAKLAILNKLNDLTLYNNFVITNKGDMIKVGDEGFVLSATDAKGCKLVDRYTFSKFNFSGGDGAGDIVKGWSK